MLIAFDGPKPEMVQKLRLDAISVVLVKPLQGGNIGSVARAMKNMGLSRLKMVRPEGLDSEDCRKMAGKALDVLAAARLFSKFEEAVADEEILIGTSSARERSLRQRLYTPREIGPLIRRYAAQHRVALVFGSERSGLTDDQLARCQYAVCIPANPIYPVLNLSQAVLILAYEVFNAEPSELNPGRQLATVREREQMFQHLEQVLVRIGFLSSQNPAPIMRSIRRFLGRADLTPRDIQILRGICSHMEWFARRGRLLDADKVVKK